MAGERRTRALALASFRRASLDRQDFGSAATRPRTGLGRRGQRCFAFVGRLASDRALRYCSVLHMMAGVLLAMDMERVRLVTYFMLGSSERLCVWSTKAPHDLDTPRQARRQRDPERAYLAPICRGIRRRGRRHAWSCGLVPQSRRHSPVGYSGTCPIAGARRSSSRAPRS